MHQHPLLDIRKYFVGQRRAYPLIIGGLFWIIWIVSSSLGPGNYDLISENVVATDYMMAYSSGQALSEGAADELFNYDAQLQRQIPIIGETDIASFSLNLPILQWIYVPFSYLPYLWSVVAWSAFGVGLVALSLKLLGRLDVFPLVLSFIPVFTNLTFGQNAFVSLIILSAVYVLWSKDKRFLAGLTLGLLIYKPQLLTGIGLLWLLNSRRDWPSLAGLATGVSVMLGLMFGLMPQASSDYVDFLRNDAGNLAEQEEFPIFHMHNPRGFFELLIPALADPLWLITAFVGIGAFVQMWRKRGDRTDAALNRPFWFSAAILLTLWATPHALVYDWTLLVIPAILLWKARPDWHEQLGSLYIWGWLAYALSLSLTQIQLRISPFAVQLSVVFLALAMYSLVRLFHESPTGEVTPIPHKNSVASVG